MKTPALLWLLPPARPSPWRAFAMRGVRTAAFGLCIAFVLWSIGHGAALPLVVYSLCIALSCWLLIDGARQLLTRWIDPATGATRGGRTVMAAVVVVGAVCGYALGNAVGNALTGLRDPGPFEATPAQLLPILVLAIVPAIIAVGFFTLRETVADQAAAVERAERRLAEERLKLLESQLEPHMLFNTLANLRALIAADPPRAQAMLDRLIAFLRASLAGSRADTHTLAAELDRVRDYLELMGIRMGARLATHIALPEALRDVEVPPMILQPIVENAVRHGLEPKREGGRIDIEARRDGDALVLTVDDDGVGLGAAQPPSTAAGGGYGLAHVRERLAALRAESPSTAVAPAFRVAARVAAEPSHGTRAELRLPLRRAGA